MSTKLNITYILNMGPMLRVELLPLFSFKELAKSVLINQAFYKLIDFNKFKSEDEVHYEHLEKIICHHNKLDMR